MHIGSNKCCQSYDDLCRRTVAPYHVCVVQYHVYVSWCAYVAMCVECVHQCHVYVPRPGCVCRHVCLHVCFVYYLVCALFNVICVFVCVLACVFACALSSMSCVRALGCGCRHVCACVPCSMPCVCFV